jgi:hypothetical protein
VAGLFRFPSAEVQFRADGGIDGSDSAARALAADPGVTDLLVLTHGWNNDVAGARDLFAQLARSLRGVVDDGHGLPSGRTLGILGVIWLSRQFALPDQMAGVAAAAGAPVTEQDLLDGIDGLRAVFPDEAPRLDAAAALVPQLTDKASARRASYAVASRLANQIDTGIGGPDDRYGSLGHNGALRTDEALPGALLPVGGAYPWQPHRPHNLLADAFVADHSDVKGREVAYALLSAAATT